MNNGTGIAVDSAYVYLTTDFNRLLIGQYLQIEDTAGIPPTIRITSPASGDTVIEGSTLPITVDAVDDIAVAAVNLLANGTVVAPNTAPPYQLNVTVPVGTSTLTLSATATDFGGNTGTAENVVVNVVPDMPPTAKILSPGAGDTVIEGDKILVTVQAADDVALKAVKLLVNGDVIATDQSAPVPGAIHRAGGCSQLGARSPGH